MDHQSLALVALAFVLGGILKGATGAGAPIIAVPLLSSLFGVQFAVAVFVLPNILPNLWQAWQYRKVELSRRFILSFAVAGAIGAAVGTYVLASVSSDLLVAGVALVVLVYVGFRLFNPSMHLSWNIAQKLAHPVGFIACLLQGATGLSAPVSITFLSALKLERPQFILAISSFFFGLGVVQLPLQFAMNIMTGERLLLSALAVVPLIVAMPVGAQIGRKISRDVFDRLLLGVLSVLAARMLYGLWGGA